jgi:signal transduction histidine kinase
VINLVSNAVKFTGQHSSVELSAVIMTRAEAVHAARTALCSDILHQERERERAGTVFNYLNFIVHPFELARSLSTFELQW